MVLYLILPAVIQYSVDLQCWNASCDQTNL